jgi:hypothetical protein
MADLYTRLQQDARRGALATIQTTDKTIAAIYSKAADDLTVLASAQKAGSLTQRWQADMAASLNERMRQLNGDVLAAVTGAAGKAAKMPGAAAADWLSGVLQKATGATGGDAFRSVMTRTSDEALRAVVTGQAYLDSKKLSRRIWKTNRRAQEGINEILQQGVAQKKSAYQVAKELEAYVKPRARENMDWRKVYPDLPEWLDDRWTVVENHAQTAARTSINHAYHIATKEAAAANPFAKAIHWELSPSHYDRQVRPFGADVCDEYADHNEGLGRGNWPIKSVPLPHARCLCSQWAVVPETLDACASRLKGWLDGESDPELDGAFGDWKGALQGETKAGTIDHTTGDRRTKLMDTIISQRWAQKLKIPDRENVMQVFLNATDDELELWAKHGGLVKGEFYSQTSGSYSAFSKTIKMDIGKTYDDDIRIGQQSGTVTFFHEAGHVFDYRAYPGQLIRDEIQDYHKLLGEDYLQYANALLKSAGEEPLSKLAQISVTQKHVLLKDLFDDEDLKSSISDIVGGLTNRELTNHWGHSVRYWARSPVEEEAFANMFEAMMLKGERLDTMQAYFPNAYAELVRAIRKLEGVK